MKGHTMPGMTIFKDPSITITVIDGVPPVDQSAQVAALTADLATRTAERDALAAKIAAAQAALA